MHKPWLTGDDVEYEDFAIITPTNIYPATPNILNPRLGPIDGSLCDSLNIDNNPVAQFRYYQDDSLDYLNIGFVDLSYMAPTSWQWDFDDGGESTEQYPTHRYNENGVYKVCLTASNENSSSTTCDTLYLGVSSLDENVVERHITLFPNPVEDVTRVAMHDYLPKAAKIRIYDQLGKLVTVYPLQGVMTNINMQSLSSAVYFYEILDSGVVISGGKFVKI